MNKIALVVRTIFSFSGLQSPVSTLQRLWSEIFEKYISRFASLLASLEMLTLTPTTVPMGMAEALVIAALLVIPMVVTLVTLPPTWAIVVGTECPMVPTLSGSTEPPLLPSLLLQVAMLELAGNEPHLHLHHSLSFSVAAPLLDLSYV